MDDVGITILGTHIDPFSKADVLARIEGILDADEYHQIATINPEFLLGARKNDKFRDVLNNCDINVPDGVGITYALKIINIKRALRELFAPSHTSYFTPHTSHLTTYPGIDLMWDILEIADQKKLRVFLVTNKDGLSTWQQTATAIKKIYPELEIDGINSDPHDPAYQLHTTSYQLVFCNFGAPAQEYFLNDLRSAKISDVRLSMGVGGAFDYISGKVARAPKWMQKAGLEWFYRLITQPRRASRIWNAVIIFPLLILFTHDNDK